MDAPSLEAFKARLYGALSNLFWWKVSLPFNRKITTDFDRSSILGKVFNKAVGNSSYFEAIPHITHSLKIC